MFHSGLLLVNLNKMSVWFWSINGELVVTQVFLVGLIFEIFYFLQILINVCGIEIGQEPQSTISMNKIIFINR